MTTRSDVKVDWYESPRVAEVALPSDEFIMQDVVDTLRKQEDTFQGMSEPRLLDAAGKESLGGGVLNGITVSLQNTLIAFAGRTTAAQIGTVTTGSGTPIGEIPHYTFIDTSATFISNNVARGSLIINFTDQSISEVYRVDSETELTTKVLVNGSTNDWTVADDYQVYNITQVRATGGNLVAVDELGSALPSGVLPTWGTQVLVTSSSSATLQEIDEIRFSAYGGGVTLATTHPNAISGTDYPAGTLAVPSNNWADAIQIHLNLGLNKIYLNSESYTVPSLTDLSTDIWIVGSGATVTMLEMPEDVNTTNLRIQDCAIMDSWIDDANLVERCTLQGCSMSGGYYFENAFAGSQVLTGSGQVNIYQCYSAVAGGGPTQTPEFNVGDAIVAGRNWTGGVEFLNKTSTAAFSWDMVSGRVQVNDNNVAGEITLRGNGEWDNESTYAGTTVVNNQMSNDQSMAAAVWNALVASYVAAGSFGEFVQKKLLTVKKYLGLK